MSSEARDFIFDGPGGSIMVSGCVVWAAVPMNDWHRRPAPVKLQFSSIRTMTHE